MQLRLTLNRLCRLRLLTDRHLSFFLSFFLSAGYGSSKAGVIQLTKVAACELAPYHIRCNAIAPGGQRFSACRGHSLLEYRELSAAR